MGALSKRDIQTATTSWSTQKIEIKKENITKTKQKIKKTASEKNNAAVIAIALI